MISPMISYLVITGDTIFWIKKYKVMCLHDMAGKATRKISFPTYIKPAGPERTGTSYEYKSNHPRTKRKSTDKREKKNL